MGPGSEMRLITTVQETGLFLAARSSENAPVPRGRTSCPTKEYTTYTQKLLQHSGNTSGKTLNGPSKAQETLKFLRFI